jgi:hypothetical protein
MRAREMVALSRFLGRLFAYVKVNIDHLIESVAPRAAWRDTETFHSPNEAVDIPVRLAIDQWDLLSEITVTLDGRHVAIDPPGFAEVSLSPGIAHVFVARGTRAAMLVSGTLTCMVTADAANKPLAMTLV